MKETHQEIFEKVVEGEVREAISHTGATTDFIQWFKELHERLVSLSLEHVDIVQTLQTRSNSGDTQE